MVCDSLALYSDTYFRSLMCFEIFDVIKKTRSEKPFNLREISSRSAVGTHLVTKTMPGIAYGLLLIAH